MAAEPEGIPAGRMDQSLDEFEEAFERESEIDQKRRRDLRVRAANRSRARHIVRGEQRGRVRFSVLAIALTVTAVTVVVVMFETLAWLVGG
ncbi:MAG: hypothetical protein H0V25_07630 [Solirubrobacterales bacterium]|nr:hypothetical protein [Solirubrobacterales bacterium]